MQGNSATFTEKYWSVWVNGSEFVRYKSLTFSRDLKRQCGAFSIVTSNTLPIDYPIQINDEIQIKYGNDLVFTGWGDKILLSGSQSGNEIKLEGRDKNIADLIDSSVPDAVKNIKGSISLIDLCQKCIKSLGLNCKVIDKSAQGSKAEKQQQTAESGQKIGDFLAKFAAKNQLYLFADQNGDLVIYKTSENNTKNSKKLIYGFSDSAENNLLNAEYELNLTEVFAKVKVRGQGAVGYEEKANQDKKSVDMSDEALDKNARPSRYIEIAITEPTTQQNAKQRAIDEVNLRNARAQSYRCTLPVFWDESGAPFELGQLFEIDDDLHLCKGSFLLSAFTVSFDPEQGTSVSLEFAPPAAYAVIEFDKKTERQQRRKRKNYIKKQNKKEQEKVKNL